MEVAESPTHSALSHPPSGEAGCAELGVVSLASGGGSRGGGGPGILLMALPTLQEKEVEEGISQESSEEEQ